ncbi:MAG: Gfo/Idh/MocA family oxidoreductase [Caldilineaceae bacterium]
MTKTINIGVIGMGWMGMVHARAYRNVYDRFYDKDIRAHLVLCADEVESRAQRAVDTFGFSGYTKDWREVIAHPDIHVVNITSPNFLHVPMVEAAAKAGKHIFCEKPVGRWPEETAQCEAFAQEAGVLTWVGFNYRWAPMVQYARQLIQNGELGELTNYRGRFFSMYGSNPMGLLSWRFEKEKAGSGAMGDLFSHVIDMAHFIAGPMKRVTSFQHTFIPERPLPSATGSHYALGKPGDRMGTVSNEDYIGALVEFTNGVRGSLETSRTVFGPKSECTFELYGTKGALRWNFERMNELELYLPGNSISHDGFTRLVAGENHPFHSRFNPGDGNSIGYEEMKCIEAYHFLQSIVDGKQGSPGFGDVLEVANAEAAIKRSWDSGGWETVTSLRR